MNQEHQAELKAFTPQHDFFVGIDSDGCAFNSMEVKHNDGFSVSLIKHFGLAGISRQVHQVWDFVNLYSKNRHVKKGTMDREIDPKYCRTLSLDNPER